MMEVAAVMVTAWLVDADVLLFFSANTAGCVRSHWLLKLYLSLVCEIARTTGSIPNNVGRGVTCQRTKKVATGCAMCAISKWMVTQPGDNGNFHD